MHACWFACRARASCPPLSYLWPSHPSHPLLACSLLKPWESKSCFKMPSTALAAWSRVRVAAASIASSRGTMRSACSSLCSCAPRSRRPHRLRWVMYCRQAGRAGGRVCGGLVGGWQQVDGQQSVEGGNTCMQEHRRTARRSAHVMHEQHRPEWWCHAPPAWPTKFHWAHDTAARCQACARWRCVLGRMHCSMGGGGCFAGQCSNE